MNLSTIVAMLAGAFTRAKIQIPKTEAAVKAARKSAAISPAVFYRRGKSQRKKSDRRRYAAKKAHIRRMKAA